MVRLLEEENSQLRAELLKCQEAAKQAFLRSANALNSEAITMFQDAATRRLGYDESSEGRSSPNPPPPSSSSGPSSPGSPEASRGRSGSDGGHQGEAPGEPKASGGGYFSRGGLRGGAGGEGGGAEASAWGRRGSASREEAQRHSHERASRGGYDDGGALHGPRGLPSQRRTYPDSPFGSEESLESRDSDAYPTQAQRAGLPRSFPFGGSRDGSDASDDGWGRAEEQGAVPRRRAPGPAAASDYAPDSLREETRARLSQLQDDRRNRMSEAQPAPPPTGQGRAPRTLASRPASARPCRCRAPSAGPKDPYRCPYCTPIQNSSFGHAKDALRKPETREGPRGAPCGSNLTRSAILAGVKADQKRVIYKPSASTVVIEKHLKN